MAEDRFGLLEQRLQKRIDELNAAGPGEVRCDRIHQIDEVRSLRACQEVLSSEERDWIAQQRSHCESELFGLQLSGPSNVSSRHRSTSEPDHWIQMVVPFALHPLQGLRYLLVDRHRQHTVSEPTDQLVEEAERAPLPAPADLVDAAVAWLTAGLAEGRTRHPLAPLRRPWESASVVPLGTWDRH